ncbi:helix-hairpin-helix domain-containing protein [Halobellus sp. Atlit-31R]|nr:helix-hairpin-helix domain-containing protein [Halobellus sp. Atlit-31R]
MSLFDTIVSSLRSLVGGESTDESDTSASSDSAGRVSVERDPDREAADASTEARIKGTADGAEEDPDAETTAETDVPDEAADAAAAETDAAASTETLVDDETGIEAAEAVETAGEGDEAVTPEPDADEVETPTDAAAAGTDAAASTETLVDEAAGREPAEAVAPTEKADGEEADEADSADADEAETDADAGPADESPPVETLKGIGPAYAERLGTVGIETVSDLAAADADEVAAEIDVSAKRVSRWIDRASDQS